MTLAFFGGILELIISQPFYFPFIILLSKMPSFLSSSHHPEVSIESQSSSVRVKNFLLVASTSSDDECSVKENILVFDGSNRSNEYKLYLRHCNIPMSSNSSPSLFNSSF